MISLSGLLKSRFPLIASFVVGASIEGFFIFYFMLNRTEASQTQAPTLTSVMVPDPLYMLPFALFIYVGLAWALYLMKKTHLASYIPAFLGGIFLPSQPFFALFLLITSFISAVLIDRIDELDS